MTSTRVDDGSGMQAYYAQRATHYEEIYRKPERQCDLNAIKRALAHGLAGRRVLDVACGTGYFTAVYAPAAKSVVGVDSSEEALALAREKRCPNSSFRHGDAFDLDVNLGDFDVVLLSFWWSHIPKKKLASFLAQLHQRLAPGGSVIFFDNRYVPGNSTPLALTDTDGDTWQDRPREDGSRQLVLKNFPSYGELRAATTPSISTHWWLLEYYWWFEYQPAR